jgi:hypothetical protein
MCDNDSDWEHISEKQVKTRKAQTCTSCGTKFPAGTVMRRICGKADGDITSQYACEACCWAFSQREHSPLHLCWGWSWDGRQVLEHGGYADELHAYITYCLANSETPTVTGWAAIREQHRAAEEAEEHAS